MGPTRDPLTPQPSPSARGFETTSSDTFSPASPGTVARGSETVLVAEDEPGVLTVVQRVLEELGYTVLVAGAPAEAEELMVRHAGQVDLLLTDVVMPGGSGPELYARLSAQYPALKVLYMSGYADRGAQRHRLIEAGSPYLQKPFTPPTLGQKVREVLGDRESGVRRQKPE